MGRLTRPSRVAAWAVILALGAVVTVGIVACGEDEPPPELAAPTPTVAAAALSPTPEPSPTVVPVAAAPTTTPSPTATPTPTPSPRPTATPSPTPTPEPTAAPDASDFDRSRLQEAIASNPPESIRTSQETKVSPTAEGVLAVTIEWRLADEAVRILMAFGFEDQKSSIEYLIFGGTQYVRGIDAAGTESPWLASTIGGSGPVLIGPLTTADLLAVMLPDDELAQIVAVGIEDCGVDRQCFVLTSPEETSGQMLVDTETYLPVMASRLLLDEESGAEVKVLLEWNPDITISAPEEAEQVSPDDVAFAVVSFLFMAQGIGQGPAQPPVGVNETVVEVPAEKVRTVVVTETVVEVPVTAVVTVVVTETETGREVPVEAVVADERTELWRELGASSYGEALDNAGDLFHGDPGITAVRFDPTIDIRRWGVGVVELADSTSRELFGPDGAFPCGSADPVVACGADGVSAGSYLLVWIALLEPVPLDDAGFVRSYWAVFEDGDPSNDWVALPQFANDVLDGSDTHYRLETTPDGWDLARTFGPQLEPMRTTGAAMILEDIVVFLVPASEIANLDALSLGVASFSGPVSNPFGVGGALDRSPDAQQPLTPLGEVGF